jgi:hypothetical protein
MISSFLEDTAGPTKKRVISTVSACACQLRWIVPVIGKKNKKRYSSGPGPGSPYSPTRIILRCFVWAWHADDLVFLSLVLGHSVRRSRLRPRHIVLCLICEVAQVGKLLIEASQGFRLFEWFPVRTNERMGWVRIKQIHFFRDRFAESFPCRVCVAAFVQTERDYGIFP